MVLATRLNVSPLVNNQPKKYETPFDNLNFWKQFRGASRVTLTSEKGKGFLVETLTSNVFIFTTCTHQQC